MPLSLSELLRSSILVNREGHNSAPDPTTARDTAGAGQPVPPVLLSQADHPATGRMCWFVHPCETETLVQEILEASDVAADGQGEEGAVRWFETWLMVLGSLVDLRP